MNPYEMNREKLFHAVREQLLGEIGFDIYSDESGEKARMLIAYIESLPFLDAKFKMQFAHELYMTVDGAALDAFDTGLNIGLSLLTNLLNGEMPEFQVRYKLHRKTPQVYREVFQKQTNFAEYMKKAEKYLTEEEVKELESKAAFFMQEHLNEITGMY